MLAEMATGNLWLLKYEKCGKNAPYGVLEDAVTTALTDLSEERARQELPLSQFQREIASWPTGLHMALLDMALSDPQVFADTWSSGSWEAG
jgi:hypothetical protein